MVSYHREPRDEHGEHGDGILFIVFSLCALCLLCVLSGKALILDAAEARPPAALALDSADYGPNLGALRELGVPAAHALGLSGRGVRIAILDTGFDLDHPALRGRRILAARDFAGGDDFVFPQPGDALAAEAHGTAVFSLVGGYDPGRLVAPAHGADFILARVDPDPGIQAAGDTERWVQALEWAMGFDPDIVVTGLGYAYSQLQLDGDASEVTRAADAAAAAGALVVVPVGDLGPAAGRIVAPADGDSVLAVGAVDETGTPGGFSSRGPTADGRPKPELVARGTGNAGLTVAAPGGGYVRVSGTAYAAALVAGTAALFHEAWPGTAPMQLRAALLRAGSRADRPDPVAGAGIPDGAAALLFPDGVQTSIVTGTRGDSLTTLAPLFTWIQPRAHPLAGQVAYRLVIGADPDVRSVVYSDTTSTGVALRVRTPLAPREYLWWRVVASAEDGTAARSRPSGPVVVPYWVRLDTLNESRATYIGTRRPRLKWSALEAPAPIGPLTFDVQILAHGNGAVLQSVTGVRDSVLQIRDPLAFNVPYRWRVVARTRSGAADTVTSIAPFIVTSATRPPATLLYQNFPNPFPRLDVTGHERTLVWFDIAERTRVELAVYDLRGRLVRRLIPARPGCGTIHLDPGLYGRSTGSSDPCIETFWNGRDESGDLVPRGVYLLRMITDQGPQVKKVLFTP